MTTMPPAILARLADACRSAPGSQSQPHDSQDRVSGTGHIHDLRSPVYIQYDRFCATAKNQHPLVSPFQHNPFGIQSVQQFASGIEKIIVAKEFYFGKKFLYFRLIGGSQGHSRKVQQIVRESRALNDPGNNLPEASQISPA